MRYVVHSTRRVLYSVFQKGAWSCPAQNIDVKARRSFFRARRLCLGLTGAEEAEAITKTLILAGGLGTRLSEETRLVPKPMVEIGGKPILWHIMKSYSFHGFDDFVILTGYKSHVIKDFFVTYYQRYSDLTVDLATNSVEIHRTATEPWKVTLLYTGEATMTGGRIRRARDYVGSEPFMLTYGDGVSDVDVNDLVRLMRPPVIVGGCTRLRQEVGYRPRYELQEAVAEILAEGKRK